MVRVGGVTRECLSRRGLTRAWRAGASAVALYASLGRCPVVEAQFDMRLLPERPPFDCLTHC